MKHKINSLILTVAVGVAVTFSGAYGAEIRADGSFFQEMEIKLPEVEPLQTNPSSKPARTYWFHSDQINSTSMITDKTGRVVSRMEYAPYGESLASGENVTNRKYTGQIEDAGTGLMYYNARYYDPFICRFISPDSEIPDMENTQSFNRYMYVAGNPIKYNDPTGHKWNPFKGLKRFWRNEIKDTAIGHFLTNEVGGAFKSMKKGLKRFFKHNREILGTVYGAGLLGPLGAVIGYHIGSKGGIVYLWNEHKWFRTVVRVTMTLAAVTAVAFGAGMAAFAASIYIGAGITSVTGLSLLGISLSLATGITAGAAIGAGIGGFVGSVMNSQFINNLYNGSKWQLSMSTYISLGVVVGIPSGFYGGLGGVGITAYKSFMQWSNYFYKKYKLRYLFGV